ncbi:MAG: RraA family protein [Bacteroidota bacterium]
MDLREKMIDLIERNRISATEVADALGKNGVIDGIDILNSGQFIAGEAYYVLGFDRSNWPIHEQIVDVKEGSIVYIDMLNCGNQAAFGDLVAKYLKLYRKVKGMVINGLMRDNHTLVKERYPVWCQGVSPLGCYNRKVTWTEEVTAHYNKQKETFHQGILVCDDSGVTLIRPDQITDSLYHKLEFIEIQEDIWFYCIDTLKWSTYDTVCLKRYLSEPEVLPTYLRERVSNMDLEK